MMMRNMLTGGGGGGNNNIKQQGGGGGGGGVSSSSSSSSLSLTMMTTMTEEQRNIVNGIRDVLEQWNQIDFPSLQNQLNLAHTSSKEQREASKMARTHLADRTKQFKRCVKSMENACQTLRSFVNNSHNNSKAEEPSSSPSSSSSLSTSFATASTAILREMEGLSKECRVLVKSYQEEIDNLTRRCKSSETMLSTLHAHLCEVHHTHHFNSEDSSSSLMVTVSDPRMALEASVRTMTEQQRQLEQLYSTLESVNAEMTRMQAEHQSVLADRRQKRASAVASAVAASASAEEEANASNAVAAAAAAADHANAHAGANSAGAGGGAAAGAGGGGGSGSGSAASDEAGSTAGTTTTTTTEMASPTSNNHNSGKASSFLAAVTSTTSSSSMSKEEREELMQLRKEVAEYEVEFRSLKNQDITIRKLESKLSEMETQSQRHLEEHLEQARIELQQAADQRIEDALSREEAAHVKCQVLQVQLRSEIAGREATQQHLLRQQDGAAHYEAAWEAQRSILLADCERLRESLHAVTRERDDLQYQAMMTSGGGPGGSGRDGGAMRSSRLPASFGGAAAAFSSSSTSATSSKPNSGNLAVQPPASGNSAAGMAFSDLVSERKAFEAEVSELSHMTNALREEVKLKEDILTEERKTFQANLDDLQRTNAALSQKVTKLESKLAAAPSQATLESMKRELRILKRLEYNDKDGEDDDDDEDFDDDEWGREEPEMTTSGPTASNASVAAGGGKASALATSSSSTVAASAASRSAAAIAAAGGSDLESVLVAKLKRVESELVRERNARVDVTSQLHDLQAHVLELEKKQKESDQLVANLESDLERAIAASAAAAASSSSIHNKSGKHPHADSPLPIDVADAENPDTLQSILDPTSAAAGASRGKNPRGAGAGGAGGRDTASSEKAQDDHSVATIVMAQRDRLRVRCEAMEAERDSFKRELQAQVAAMESLKADNTKLYEKVRYLQNFNTSGGGGSGGIAAGMKSRGGGGGGGRGVADRDLDLEALEQRYEASVDPFRQFSRAERQRKLKEMSPMERIVFVVAKTVLGSKEMRTALFFYVIGMHLLVFFTTTHWSHHGCDHHTHHVERHHEMLSNMPPDQQQHIVEAYAASAAALNGTATMVAAAAALADNGAGGGGGGATMEEMTAT